MGEGREKKKKKLYPSTPYISLYNIFYKRSTTREERRRKKKERKKEKK